MANLLPIEAQKKVWGMYRARFVIVGSLALLTLAGIALIALVPSYFALSLAAPEIEAPQNLHGERIDDPTSITRAQALVEAFQPLFEATTTPSQAMTTALQARPRGVSIDRVSYRTGQFVLSGSASREQIEAYRAALDALPLFDTVSIPVSSLVGRDDNRFSITLSGAF